MSTPVMYRQCELRSVTESGVARRVAWLPAEYRTGRVVRLDGSPRDWRIINHGEARSAEIVEAYEANGRRGLPSVSGHEREMA